MFSARTIGVDEANQGTAALPNLAWATPVLYLRDQDGDGQLFRLTA
jgi:hypothetical protein